ncbi:MAG: hypothetical protein U0625_03945 [Phycisphaerales bacterium]
MQITQAIVICSLIPGARIDGIGPFGEPAPAFAAAIAQWQAQIGAVRSEALGRLKSLLRPEELAWIEPPAGIR